MSRIQRKPRRCSRPVQQNHFRFSGTAVPEFQPLIPSGGGSSMRRAILALTLAGLTTLFVAGLFTLQLFADKPNDDPSTKRPAPLVAALAQASRSESSLKLPVARV